MPDRVTFVLEVTIWWTASSAKSRDSQVPKLPHQLGLGILSMRITNRTSDKGQPWVNPTPTESVFNFLLLPSCSHSSYRTGWLLATSLASHAPAVPLTPDCKPSPNPQNTRRLDGQMSTIACVLRLKMIVCCFFFLIKLLQTWGQ